jgi:glutamine amidotransferase
VLPGVGAFADCMRGVSSIPGMVDALEDSVLKRGTPFLGICVGMQLLAEIGREHGDHKGLGWIEATW